jgi:hypothetical protein
MAALIVLLFAAGLIALAAWTGLLMRRKGRGGR